MKTKLYVATIVTAILLIGCGNAVQESAAVSAEESISEDIANIPEEEVGGDVDEDATETEPEDHVETDHEWMEEAGLKEDDFGTITTKIVGSAEDREKELLFDGINHEPTVPENIDKTVIGKDDRVVIENTACYPYSAVAYLEVEYECGEHATCSGFMVGNKTMATAAHCLICSDHRKPVKYLTAYFGYKSRDSYYYRYNDAATIWTWTDFPNGYDNDAKNWDLGLVVFNKDVGSYTGTFGLMALSDDEINQQYWGINAGYRSGILRAAVGEIEAYDPYRIRNLIDTESGNSGGPVFVEQGKGNYYAIGIITSGNKECNYARRIDANYISETIKADY